MAKYPYPLDRWWGWVLGIIATLTLIIIALSYLIHSEYLRCYAEHQMNKRLKGYTVHVGRAFFHPIGFSLDLRELILIQDANPNPPVAKIEQLLASVHWRELIRGHVVGDFLIDRPKVYINLKHLKKEEESKVPLNKKGWQDALESIYPLKINVFRIHDGELTYVDEAPYKPLRATQIYLKATNIRNIEFPDRVYPSPVHLEGRIFDRGNITLDGHANFLEEPHAGFKVDIELTDMDLGYFKPITNRRNINVQKGMVSAKGNLEYAPQITAVNLKTLEIKGVEVDYIHLLQTAGVEEERVHKAARTAEQLSNKPSAKIRADVVKIDGSSFGYVNKIANPGYRVFVDHTRATLKNFSNQFVEGPATFEMTGKFMGSGNTRVTGKFRPETKNPNFDLNIAIENTDMVAMSNLFRAYGNFDIKAGLFSFYSELTINGEKIDGYVKPLFRDMKVYDRRPKEDQTLFHRLYVGLIGGISKLLENRPREEIATKTPISGTIANPKTNTWQIIINLIRNAFIKSILPGFEKEVRQPERG